MLVLIMGAPSIESFATFLVFVLQDISADRSQESHRLPHWKTVINVAPDYDLQN